MSLKSWMLLQYLLPKCPSRSFAIVAQHFAKWHTRTDDIVVQNGATGVIVGIIASGLLEIHIGCMIPRPDCLWQAHAT